MITSIHNQNWRDNKVRSPPPHPDQATAQPNTKGKKLKNGVVRAAPCKDNKLRQVKYICSQTQKK